MLDKLQARARVLPFAETLERLLPYFTSEVPSVSLFPEPLALNVLVFGVVALLCIGVFSLIVILACPAPRDLLMVIMAAKS